MFKDYNSILVKARGSYRSFDEDTFVEAFEKYFGIPYEGNVKPVRYASQAVKESVNTENIILFIDSFKDYNNEDSWKSAEKDRRKDVNPEGKFQYKAVGDDIPVGYFGEDNLLKYLYDKTPRGVHIYMCENHKTVDKEGKEQLTVSFSEFTVERQHGFSKEVVEYAAYTGLKAKEALYLKLFCNLKHINKDDFALNGFIPCPHCAAEGKIHWQFFNPDSAYDGVKEYSGAANSVVCSECSRIINRDDTYPDGKTTVVKMIHQLESKLATKSEFEPNPKGDLEDYRSLKMSVYDEYMEMLMTIPEEIPVRLADKTKVRSSEIVTVKGRPNPGTNKGTEWRPMSLPLDDSRSDDPIKASAKRWQRHFKAPMPDGSICYSEEIYDLWINEKSWFKYAIPAFPNTQSNIRF